ncbi:hypothetical protein ACWD4T_52715, partial [Streptomyces umbrinus]
RALPTALHNTLTGHTEGVTTVACTTLDVRSVAVTGSLDCTVQVWDLSSGEPIGQPLTGHTQQVTAVACTTLHGQPVAVTDSEDHMVRVWDLVGGACTV